jgi:hypothetical protein
MDRVDVLATVGYNGTLIQFSIHTQPSYHIALNLDLLFLFYNRLAYVYIPRSPTAGQGSMQ